MRVLTLVLVLVLAGCDSGPTRSNEERILARASACRDLGGEFIWHPKGSYERRSRLEWYEAGINLEPGKWECRAR